MSPWWSYVLAFAVGFFACWVWDLYPLPRRQRDDEEDEL